MMHSLFNPEAAWRNASKRRMIQLRKLKSVSDAYRKSQVKQYESKADEAALEQLQRRVRADALQAAHNFRPPQYEYRGGLFGGLFGNLF